MTPLPPNINAKVMDRGSLESRALTVIMALELGYVMRTSNWITYLMSTDPDDLTVVIIPSDLMRYMVEQKLIIQASYAEGIQ